LEQKAHDRRQLILMQDVIESYLLEKRSLNALSTDLEFLHYQLEDKSQAWKDGFRPAWEVIEEVNAVLLYQIEQGLVPSSRSLGRLDQDLDSLSLQLVQGSLDKLSSLITSELARNL
jgi:hypothetical protein